MSAPFPGLSCRVLFTLYVFLKEQTILAFNWDMFSHLALCFDMMLLHLSDYALAKNT